MEDLTRNQAFIIAVLYKYYTERLNDNMTKEEANNFKDSYSLQEDYFCDKDKETFIDNLNVVFEKGYVDGQWDGTKINEIKISKKGFESVNTNLLSK